jgi:hypothetical protein
MVWTVEFCPEFDQEFDALDQGVQNELLAYVMRLEERGPDLRRPHADTLHGSKIANLKELRFVVGRHEWRVAYAFDPKQAGILLCAGDKAGVDEQRFYKRLIKRAETRYEAHLKRLKEKR